MLCKVCHIKPRYKRSGLCLDCFRERYARTLCPICHVNKMEKNAKSCRECYYKSKKANTEAKKPIRECRHCHRKYQPKRADVQMFYCSIECYKAYLQVELSKGAEHSPAWTGTQTLEKSGYVTSYDVNGKRRRFIHIQIAEYILGRRLNKGEVVHHINLRKSDNRNCNLLICSSSYHRWLHYQMAKEWVKEHIKEWN